MISILRKNDEYSSLPKIKIGGEIITKPIQANENSISIIGVINIAPETFYKGSLAGTPKKAEKRAMKMVEAGADIIDLGAMSTAPGVDPISPHEEKKRLLPVLKRVRRKIKTTISIDTQRASVAKAAIEIGGDIINDISGFKADPKMPHIVSDFNCRAILMACDRKPGDARTIGEVRRCLRQSLELCKHHKIDLNKIIVDPGIGFGKGAKWDLHILANLDELSDLGLPICVGVSRKSFIGKVLGLKNPSDRLWGSLSATAIAVLNGAKIIRTHDTQESLHAVKIAEAIKKNGERSEGNRA